METTKEIFPEFRDDSITYYDRELLERCQHTNLMEFHSSVLQSQTEYGKIHHNDTSGREKTLTFLYQLLSERKVRVGYHTGGVGIAKEYTGTPDEIITQIRTEWSNTSEDGVHIHPIAYEMFVHIILAENPWPVWK